MFQFRISQRCLEIPTPNFHQLLTFIGTLFEQNLKALGATDLHFLPKPSETSLGVAGSLFKLHP